jgi:hypothetical protein
MKLKKRNYDCFFSIASILFSAATIKFSFNSNATNLLFNFLQTKGQAPTPANGSKTKTPAHFLSATHPIKRVSLYMETSQN